jgi:multiple sugar transport system substrate-binding protein
MADTALGRRGFLALLGGLGLAGCSFRTDPNVGTIKADKDLSLSGPALKRSGSLGFRWMDSGDLKAPFEQAVFDAYSRKNSQVKVTYDGTSWDRIDEVVPLGIRNNSAPDVFAIPNDVPTNVAVNQGWLSPLDDVIPDFDKWKRTFPSTAFVPGVLVFDGKTYGFPLSSSKRLGYMLFYDVEFLKRADLDPRMQRFTWNEFRAACKKITKQGDGKYYGLMTQGLALGPIAAVLAETAGLPNFGNGWNTAGGGGANANIDYRTGEFTFTDPRVQAAIELLLAIKSDGSFYPGYLSLDDADSRARMPQGVAGMIFDGPWDIPAWPTIDPGYKFDIALPPMPNDGRPHTLAYQEVGANSPFLYAKSKNKDIAGQLFSYMGSQAGQRAMVEITQGNLTSVMPDVNTAALQTSLVDAKAKTATGYANETLRLAPLPQIRNPATANAMLMQQPTVPTFPTVVQGIFSGQVKNIPKAMKALQDSYDKSLDDAIKAARKKGFDVSRDDWKFPNWDPAVNYTTADYQELSK